MKQFAGTPGEWAFAPSIPEEGFECYWISNGYNHITAVDGPQTAQQEANVRLMAASKDLLEALQAYMEADESDMSCREWIDLRGRARAAIAKALGE